MRFPFLSASSLDQRVPQQTYFNDFSPPPNPAVLDGKFFAPTEKLLAMAKPCRKLMNIRASCV